MAQNFALLTAVFGRRRWPAIATFASVIGGALVYLIFSPRLYEAEVRLMLDDKQASISELGRDLTTQTVRPDSNPIATQAELAHSQRVIRQALNQVYPQPTPSSSKKSGQPTVERVRNNLKVSIVPATNVLKMSYRSRDPLLGAQMLNAVAEAMINANTEITRSEAGSARRFLELEVPKKRTQLAQAEAILSNYKRTQGIISLADQNGQDNAQTRSLVESLTELENQERTITAQLQEAKVRNNSLKQVTDSSTLKSAYATVRGGQDAEIKAIRDKLVDLESRVAIARSRFTDNSPPVQTLLEQRDATRALYTQKISGLTASNLTSRPGNLASDQVSQDLATKLILGEIEVSALESKLAVVSSERTKLQTRLNDLPTREQELAAISRQREEAVSSLQFLQRKLEEARIAEAQKVSSLRIVDLAEAPDSPSWPKIPIVLVLAGATGIVLTVGVVLLLELLDGTLRNATEAEELVKLPVLGVLPVLPEEAINLEQPKPFLQDPALLESYRTLLKSLEFRSPEDLQVLVVSSTLSGEGKSVIVSHLAAVSAMLSRRTLIIDADLRRPTQHKLFNLDIKPGLTDVVNGNVRLSDAVQQTNIKNLSVLTSGKLYSHPSEFFESEQMRTLISEEAIAQYDLVIIDTPPVTSCVDALTLSRDSNKMLMVARPNFTQKDILMRAISELASNRVGVMGVAINGMNTQTESFYKYALQGYQPINTVITR